MMRTGVEGARAVAIEPDGGIVFEQPDGYRFICSPPLLVHVTVVGVNTYYQVRVIGRGREYIEPLPEEYTD